MDASDAKNDKIENKVSNRKLSYIHYSGNIYSRIGSVLVSARI